MWTASAGNKSNFKAICDQIRMPCDRNLLQGTNFMHGHWKYAQPATSTRNFSMCQANLQIIHKFLKKNPLIVAIENQNDLN